MAYIRTDEGTIDGGWNNAGRIFGVNWYLTGEMITGHNYIGQVTPANAYLKLPNGTILNRPSSGYTSFTVLIKLKVSGDNNYVVSPSTVTAGTFADGKINYFDTTDEGELFRVGCLGGSWGNEQTHNLSLAFYPDGHIGMMVTPWQGSASATTFSPTTVRSMIITCGLKAVEAGGAEQYIFDGIVTPNNDYTPTRNHRWTEYDTDTCPSIVYYGKSETITTYTPVRYELIATDSTTLPFSYTIPFLRDHFSTALEQSLDITRIVAYKHPLITPDNFITSCKLRTDVSYLYTSFDMSIPAFSNGRGLVGSSIYLYESRLLMPYFYWDNNDGSLDHTLIGVDLPIANGLTASNWTRLLNKTKEILAALGVPTTSFTTVATGDRILASYYNEISSGLTALPAAAVPVLPPTELSGNIIYASLFNASTNDLKTVLNNAILYYNNLLI